MTSAILIIARAICREKCAFMGEPPCWTVEGEPWPNTDCDEPGCHALARAAALAVIPSEGTSEWNAMVERGRHAYAAPWVSVADLVTVILHAAFETNIQTGGSEGLQDHLQAQPKETT